MNLTRNDLLIRNQYALFHGQRIPVALGIGGIGKKIREGDGITPMGIWQVVEWRARLDRLKLKAHVIGPQDRWGDASDAPKYNQCFQWDRKASHERLYRPDHLYDLIGVLDYNLSSPIPGLGSAVFIHQWRKPRHPTAGCIAFPREALIWLYQNWSKGSRVIVQE